jgi:protein gp37
MMDIFENSKPMMYINRSPILSQTTVGGIPITTNHVRNLLFDLIDRKKFENIIFLFLTKRPSNISKFIPEKWKESLPQNVWLGTSLSTQENANTLVPLLINHSPKNSKLFLSVEPQLESLKLDLWHNSIDWVIQGGESGFKRRKFNLQWAYEMYEFCLKFKIPYFFKQIDGKIKIPEDLIINQFPKF